MEIEIEKGNYLNADTCSAGDIVTILDEGVRAEITQKDGTTKNVYNFEVQIDKKPLIYTPNNKVLAMFVKAWGSNSKDWLGKQFKVRLVTIEYKGKEMEVVRPIVLGED